MFAVEIPNELAFILIGIILTGIFSWTAYMMKQATRQGEALAKIGQITLDHEHRISRLEGWRDGATYGQAVARAAHLPHEEVD